MKKLLLITLTIFMIKNASGQGHYGPVIGGRLSKTVASERSFGEPNRLLLMPSIGAFYRFDWSDRWSISAQLLLAGRGNKRVFGSSSFKERTYYLEIPLQVERAIGRHFQVFAGPYFSYGLFGKSIATIRYGDLILDDRDPYIDRESTFRTEEKISFATKEGRNRNAQYLYPIDAGFNLGANYRFDPFVLSAYYSIGLVNTIPPYKDSDRSQSTYKEHYRLVSFSVAYDITSKEPVDTAPIFHRLRQDQSFGFKIGAISSVIMDNKSEYNEEGAIFPLPVAGIIYNNKLSTAISLQTELYYSQKGDVYNYYTGFNREQTDTRVTVNYLELPLLVKAQTNNEKTNLFINSGIGFDYAIGKTSIEAEKRLYSPDGFRKRINREVYNRLNKNFQLGGGLSFAGKSSDMLIEIRYMRGLTDIFEEKSKVEAFSFTLGALFPTKPKP